MPLATHSVLPDGFRVLECRKADLVKGTLIVYGIWPGQTKAREFQVKLAALEERGWIRRPIVPEGCVHNAHMYYVLLPSLAQRQEVIRRMRERGVSPVFHYVPLHSAPAGRRFARAHGELRHTDELSDRLLRLPLWIGVDRELVIDTFSDVCAEVCGAA